MLEYPQIQMLLVNSNAWLIFGLALILIEVFFIGSMVFILPIGLAALLNGTLIFLNSLTDTIALKANNWYITMVSVSIFSFLFLFLIQFLLKNKKTTKDDVNDY